MKTLIVLLVMLFCGTVLADEANYPQEVFDLVKVNNTGLVSTIMIEDGVTKPYGSVIPFALEEGAPFIFISDLAVHTDNINANPNVSIMIFKPKEGNVFAGSRVTFVGQMKIVEDEEVIAKLRVKYLKEHPEAKQWIDFGDFNFYTMNLEGVYYIGGFGEIGWIDLKEYKKIASQ